MLRFTAFSFSMHILYLSTPTNSSIWKRKLKHDLRFCVWTWDVSALRFLWIWAQACSYYIIYTNRLTGIVDTEWHKMKSLRLIDSIVHTKKKKSEIFFNYTIKNCIRFFIYLFLMQTPMLKMYRKIVRINDLKQICQFPCKDIRMLRSLPSPYGRISQTLRTACFRLAKKIDLYF